jgi:phosphatidylglycerol:prolipoprotein diacylglycerol transferase
LLISDCGTCLVSKARSEIKNPKSEIDMIFPIPIIHIGRVAVQLPGLVLLLGFWAALWLAARQAKRAGLKEDDVYTPGLYAALAGVAGARLWYAATHWEAFANDPLGIVALNLSTLDATGGLVAGVLAGGLYAWRKKLLSARWLDALAPGVALLIAAVSLANLFSGEAYGTPSTLPWAIMLWDTERHPVQLYEMLAALVTAAVLLVALRRQHLLGVTAWLLLALYSGQRIFLEAFRAESWLLPGGWRGAQVVGLVALGVSLAMMSRRASPLGKPANGTAPDCPPGEDK